MPHFQIVSPPLPTGVTWLVNALLELGIRCTSYGAGWMDNNQGSHPAGQRLEWLKWHLPALHRSHGFDFVPGVEVFWDHVLAFAQYPARKTILFVRDLRDSAYSYVCRQLQQQDCSLAQLLPELSRPRNWDDYFPHLLELPIPDTLAYFYRIWLELTPPDHLLLVRFEDSKADAAGQLRKVLHFMGLNFSDTAIAQALQASELSRFQQIRQQLEQTTGLRNPINRKGQAFEWKTTLSESDREAFEACFAGPAQTVLARLGYEALRSEPPVRVPTQEVTELCQQVQRLLGQSRLAEARNWLQTQRQSLSAPLQQVVEGQLLALLWAEAILSSAQLHLPRMSRLANLFARLNAEFATSALRAAASRSLTPTHPLQSLRPGPPWPVSAAQDQLQSLVQALTEASLAGRMFVLWQAPGVLLKASGLLQLQALLDGRAPFVAAVVPVFENPTPEADPQAGFMLRASQQQARWGAEFQSIQLHMLPPCLLLRIDRCPRISSTTPLTHWLAALPAQLALGVLVRLPA